MVHYHGTRLACSDDQAARVLKGRHAFVSFADVSQLPIVREVCQSHVFDNGAFSLWKSGTKTDWDGYYKFIEDNWSPATDWAVIPDLISGTEREQDELVLQWPFGGTKVSGSPVWHTNETLERLDRLIAKYKHICIGSGPGHYPGSSQWWMRLHQAFDILCDKNGFPHVKVHLLRGLSVEIFTSLPLSSADSTMVGRNLDDRQWPGHGYKPASIHGRAMVLIDRIESFNSPSVWERKPIQQEFQWA